VRNAQSLTNLHQGPAIGSHGVFQGAGKFVHLCALRTKHGQSSTFLLRTDVRHAVNVRMTDELNALLDQTVAFVRLRRTSRRASAAEARAALTLEEMLEEFRAAQAARAVPASPQSALATTTALSD
jgi:hypothetical protein